MNLEESKEIGCNSDISGGIETSLEEFWGIWRHSLKFERMAESENIFRNKILINPKEFWRHLRSFDEFVRIWRNLKQFIEILVNMEVFKWV